MWNKKKEIKIRRSNKCNKNVQNYFDLREKNINFFKDYFLLLSEAKYKGKYGMSLKILTSKQMLQRLPISLAQAKAGNTSEILYILYRSKQITKKLYNNIVNSIKLWNRMDMTFMNSDKSKTTDPYRLLLNLTDKINLKWSDKYVALSNLSIYYTWKNMKNSCKNKKVKI